MVRIHMTHIFSSIECNAMAGTVTDCFGCFGFRASLPFSVQKDRSIYSPSASLLLASPHSDRNSSNRN